MKHTPTPYYLGEFDKRHIYCENQGYIAQAIQLDFAGTEAERDAETLANAAFIVRACNSYAGLVAALRRTMAWAADHPWTGLGDAHGYKDGEGLLVAIQAALAAAEEE